MKLTVLCDNNTYIDNYLYGEPAFSIYIENKKDKILFDVGYSDVFAKNAELMKINLKKINKLVFSHGHDDHTRGLKFFTFDKNTKVYFAPKCFEEKFCEKNNISAPFKITQMEQKFNLIECAEVKEVSEQLYFLGTIPRTTNFENENPYLQIKVKGKFITDPFVDDSALVYNSGDGLYIITGCSHSGICNICEYAKKVFGKKIIGIIGGFHLLKNDAKAKSTITYLKKEKIKTIYPCHCTSLSVKAEMINNNLNVVEVGSGLKLEIK